MQIDINSDIVIGEGNFLLESIDGLGRADIRTSQFLYSGRHGGEITDQYYGFRPLAIAGKIDSPTCEQHALDRQAFIEATPIGTVLPITITNFVGDSYIIYAHVIKPTCEVMVGGQMSDFLLQLEAGDPLFYNTSGGALQTAAIPRLEESGGYDTPYTLPVDWVAGSASTIVINSGNAVYYPTFVISDEVHNPIITNTATGESFSLDLSTNDGDEIRIDMLNRTVTLNGSDILGNKTDDSFWLALQIGNNPLTFNTDDDADTGTALVEWRNGVTGI